MSERKTGAEIEAWADEGMYSAQPMEAGGPRVFIVNATRDPLGTVAAMNGVYKGMIYRDLKEINDEMRRYEWEQVAKTHLKAPLEFIDLHFMIEGVTRAFTHQMVRQRTAVYGQESLRFAVKEDMAAEVDLPPTIREKSPEADAWRSAVEGIEDTYKYLIANGVPAEDARGLLPHATRTRLHYKTNLRNLLDTMANRLCTQAQFEWRFVVARMVEAIRNYSTPGPDWQPSDNWQWRLIADGSFLPVCYAKGHCPFQGDIDRPCSIRDRVEEGKFGEIDPGEWLLNVNAAR